MDTPSITPRHPDLRGHVFWLFGLSGAGKSTLAGQLADELRSRGTPILTLDGDALRSGLCQGLGFSTADRTENLRRAAEVAQLGIRSGLCVVASFITPLAANRREISAIIGEANISFIHISAPLDVCRTRDVKGLYAGATAGKVAQMTGVTSAFEPPERVALTLETARENVAASTARLLEFALRQLVPTA